MTQLKVADEALGDCWEYVAKGKHLNVAGLLVQAVETFASAVVKVYDPEGK